MSKTAQTDDIDELVSSVRDFVSHKEPQRSRSRILLDRLILTPEQRVDTLDAAQKPLNTGYRGDDMGRGARPLPPVQSFDKAGLEATIAELEAAVTAQFDDWEADEGESFAKAAWAASAFRNAPGDSAQDGPSQPVNSQAAPFADAELPQSTPAHQPPVSEAAAPDTVPDKTDQTAVATSVMTEFDEAALRKLVVQIVHEELGGELGERITRNVRKMVRREINRVLTSREMGQS